MHRHFCAQTLIKTEKGSKKYNITCNKSSKLYNLLCIYFKRSSRKQSQMRIKEVQNK